MVISVQWHLFQDYDWLRVCKLINVIRHVNRTKFKRKPHNHVSKDLEVFYEIQSLFALKKILSEFGENFIFCMSWDKFFSWSWTAPRNFSFPRPAPLLTTQITPLWHYHKRVPSIRQLTQCCGTTLSDPKAVSNRSSQLGYDYMWDRLSLAR